jgi:hypothetical protein
MLPAASGRRSHREPAETFAALPRPQSCFAGTPRIRGLCSLLRGFALKTLPLSCALPCLAPLLAIAICAPPAGAQRLAGPAPALFPEFALEPGILQGTSGIAGEDGAAPDTVWSSSGPASLPSAPEPAANPERENVPYTAQWHQQPFSRIGIGADISPLGIGIKSAVVLDDYFDVRGLFNFFGYDTGRLEVSGFNIDANFHLASVGAMVDAYPRNSIWRLSAGLMFFNGNQVSVRSNIVPGNSFTLGSGTYYSDSADPLTGSALLNLHTVRPAPMASFGFGRFVPHSNRHWSFPAEFGVVYMGAPGLAVNPTGSVCTNAAETDCSSISDPNSPVAIQFNDNLNAKLVQWRKDLDLVKFSPILSYSVVYSFNIR